MKKRKIIFLDECGINTKARNGKSLMKNIEAEKSGNAFNGFEGAIGAFRFSDNCGNSSSKKSNVSDRIHILSSIETVYSKAFLTCRFET